MWTACGHGVYKGIEEGVQNILVVYDGNGRRPRRMNGLHGSLFTGHTSYDFISYQFSKAGRAEQSASEENPIRLSPCHLRLTNSEVTP